MTDTILPKVAREDMPGDIRHGLGVIVGLVKLSFTLGLVEKESYCEFGATATG